jgi:hypothetical protein
MKGKEDEKLCWILRVGCDCGWRRRGKDVVNGKRISLDEAREDIGVTGFGTLVERPQG